MNVEQLQERRQSLITERAFVAEARGDDRRLAEIDEQIDLVDAQLAELVAVADVEAVEEEQPVANEPTAPETTEAPAAPEQAVRPAPKRSRKKAE